MDTEPAITCESVFIMEETNLVEYGGVVVQNLPPVESDEEDEEKCTELRDEEDVTNGEHVVKIENLGYMVWEEDYDHEKEDISTLDPMKEEPGFSDPGQEDFSVQRSAEIQLSTQIVVCRRCDCRFSSWEQFKIHKCISCTNGFEYEYTKYKTNVQTHMNKKGDGFECEICQKRYRFKRNLARHKHSHTTQKPYICERCYKSFSCRTSLIYHIKTHTGEKPYKCASCDKAFTGRWDLVVHTRSHMNNKPYCCEVCKKAFTQKANLLRHSRIHTGEKPYKCKNCNRCFSRQDTLPVHVCRKED